MRFTGSVLASSMIGGVLAALLAGWVNPCLGSPFWERCVVVDEIDNPGTANLPICYLGICDVFFSPWQQVTRLLVSIALVLSIAGCAAYFTKSRRSAAAGGAVVLAFIFLAVLVPYVYPHKY